MDDLSYQQINTAHNNSPSNQNRAGDDISCHSQPDSKQASLRNWDKSVSDDLGSEQPNIQIYIVDSETHSLGNSLHHMAEYSSQVHENPELLESFKKSLQEETKLANPGNFSSNIEGSPSPPSKVVLQEHSQEISQMQQSQSLPKQQLVDRHQTVLQLPAQQKHCTSDKQLAQQTVLAQQDLQVQKSLNYISDNSHLSSNVSGVYQSFQHTHDVAQSVYLLSDKDNKEGQGTVLGQIFCSDLVGSANRNVVTSSQRTSIASSDYSLMSGLDHALTHANNMSHLACPNLFHTSETDSEVALTLASLGDPKNDKFEHNFFHQRGDDFLRNEELASSFSMYSGSLKNMCSDTAGYSSLSRTSLAGGQTTQHQSSSQIISSNEPVSSDNSDTTKPFIATIPTTRPMETLTAENGALEKDNSIASTSRSVESRPTLVLRSRKGRGPSIPHHYHNFPDPEKIGKKKRKKDQKPKSSQAVQSGNSPDLLRLPVNQCEVVLPCLEPITNQGDVECTKSPSLACDVQENTPDCKVTENNNEVNFLMNEHETFQHYAFQPECVGHSRVNLHSNSNEVNPNENVVGSSSDANNIIPSLEVHNSSFHQSHNLVACSVESIVTSAQPINVTSSDICSLPHLKTRTISAGVPMSHMHMTVSERTKDTDNSMDQISMPTTLLSSISSLSSNLSLHSVHLNSNLIKVHLHSTDSQSINTSIQSENMPTSTQSMAAPSHSVNSFTHQMTMHTQPLSALTHGLNTSDNTVMTPAHPIHTPTHPINVSTHSISTVTPPSTLSSQSKNTVSYCISASVQPKNSLTHQVSMPNSLLNTSSYHLTTTTHSEGVSANTFGAESNPMATLMDPPITTPRSINCPSSCPVSIRSSDTLWNRSVVATPCNDSTSTAPQHSLPVASAQQMAALTLAEIDVLGTAIPTSTATMAPAHTFATDTNNPGRGSSLHLDDQTSLLITSEATSSAIIPQSINPVALTSRPSSLVAHHQQLNTSNGSVSNSPFMCSSSGLFYALPSSSYLTASPCQPGVTSASYSNVSTAPQQSNIMIYSSHHESDSSVRLPVTSNFNSDIPVISSGASVKDPFDITNNTTPKIANSISKVSSNLTIVKNSTDIVSNFSHNSRQNTNNQIVENTNSGNNSNNINNLHNSFISIKDHHSYHFPNVSTNSSTSIPCIASSNMVAFNAINEGSCHQDCNTVPPSVTSSPGLSLLPPLSASSEKENLLGQLLKASEHCEPASLIPAGVVNDVIPAVGYRILEVSNLSEMIRCMHSCSGSGELGTIVIQEQASLREGAVSQLSVICTACQEGTVSATSNRTGGNEGSSTSGSGGGTSTSGGRDIGSNNVGPWDINLRVQQLVQEFGVTELQVQRMLEILGIFYRPSDPDGIDANNSLDEGPAPSEDSLYPPNLPGLVTPTSSPVITSITITASDCDGEEAEEAPLEDSATEPLVQTTAQPELKFEEIRNLSSSAALGPPSPAVSGEDRSSGGRKRKRPEPKHSTNSSRQPPAPQPPLPKAKTLSCPDCSAKFVSLNHLKKHAQSHNLSQHTCPYCHSYFKKPYNLREHIKKHQNIKYDCDQCSRQFTDRSSLVVHKKSSHEMKYEFKCSECSKVFYKRVHFTDHMRLHTRETPFACEICGKRFIWRDSVKKHMDTHIAEAKYNCRLCGKWFRWLQGIRQHLQQQHKLKKCDVEAQVNTNGAATFYQKQLQSNRNQQKQQKQVPQHYHQEQLQVEIQLLQSASPHDEAFLDNSVHKLPIIDASLKHESVPADGGALLAASSGDCSSDVIMRSVATRTSTGKVAGISPNGKTEVQPGSPEIRLLLSSDQTFSSVVVTTLDNKDNRDSVNNSGHEETGLETDSGKRAESVAGLSSSVGVW